MAQGDEREIAAAPTATTLAALIDAAKVDKCTHCGFCLPTCPTYDQLGLEMDSPRGRIYLIRSVLEGRTQPDEQFRRHMYRCLECRACETACPSGVPYAAVMEQARAVYERTGARARWQRWLMRLAFEGLLPRPRRLRVMFRLLWLYQRLRLDDALRATRLDKALGRMGAMANLLPRIPHPKLQDDLLEVTPAVGERRYRVGFVSGCVMKPMFADVNLATVRVLTQNGCEVVTPSAQTCCGALQIHGGARDTAEALATKNIDLFLGEDLDAIVINSAGCGAALKEYGELFPHDPLRRERAEEFGAKTRDITEWLDEIGVTPPTHAIDRRVTYDDPCHLLHGQGIGAQPRALLRAIPGVEYVEMPEADWCCGSAGIYNVVQPELAAGILERKMPHVASTEADIVATANPGCLLQLRAGVRDAGLSMRVMHVVELLDWAYTGVEPYSTRADA
ncbi:glycolate oxidase [Candidatus Poribacteria bacterium]|nr:glycolate oxidase [Candidatus Poribacteria bacterium]